jgi:hypothetical protein
VYTVGENNQIIAINFAITNFGIIDVDALNYITAVETADGQALEENIKIAINDFIMGLKTDNIWEPIKASVIMAGAKTLNGALVPLKGHAPTNFNFVAGDYNRKTGLVGDGSTKYLNSNRNNNVDPQNSRHLAVFVNTKGTAGNTFYIGTVFGEGNSFIVIRNNTDLAHRLSGTGADIPGIHGTGFIGINRNSSTFVIGRGN